MKKKIHQKFLLEASLFGLMLLLILPLFLDLLGLLHFHTWDPSRLPSACALLLCCVLFYLFLRRFLKGPALGFIQTLVLVSSVGVFTWSGAKEGNYQALLMLFMSAYALFYLAFMETNKTKYLYVFYLCLSLAMLTKNAASFFFLPGLLVYTLFVFFTSHGRAVFKNKHLYLGLLIPLGFVGIYYVAKDVVNLDYVEAVWGSEQGERFLPVNEVYAQSNWFYIKNLYQTRFFPWFPLSICGALMGFFNRDKKIVRLSVFASAMVVSLLLFISCTGTQLFLYDIPLYPFLSLLAALFVYQIFEWVGSTPMCPSWGRKLFPILFLIIVFTWPYVNSLIWLFTHPEI